MDGKDEERSESVPETPVPCRDEDGVDVSLIRWMLSLTPKERLMVLQNNVNSLIRLSNAKRK